MKKLFVSLFCIGMIFLTACSKGIGEEGISKEEFGKLRVGMPMSDAVDLIGGYGEQIAESKDERYLTFTYKYQGEKGGYAIIVYEADYTRGLDTTVIIRSYENHDIK